MTAEALFASSGDLLADRRYGLGRAFAEEGDHAAAADLFAQALLLAPEWAAGWLALGLAQEQRDDAPAARDALRRAAALDRDGRLGAALHLARLEAPAAVKAMPGAFVRELFDRYADRFESHLTEVLRYRGPALIVSALDKTGAARFRAVLDLGCGTGLMACALTGRAEAIDGVDLSPRMVDKARRSGLYRRLDVADLGTALAGAEPGAFDLVVAADVLVYLGSLDETLAGSMQALCSGGVLAFTVQELAAEADFRLGADMRFSHSRDYVARALGQAGFHIASIAPDSSREDRGVPVLGLVVVARKP